MNDENFTLFDNMEEDRVILFRTIKNLERLMVLNEWMTD